MATSNEATTTGLNDENLSRDDDNVVINGIALPSHNTADQISSDVPRCFVCDVKVQGRHYALATCRTQSSRARVIEKLGELVGERYMVVISEDDVICRGCANLMNTLDRLESEMKGVRDAILRFLERKYSLDDGELLGSVENAKPCQPPQITKSHTHNGTGYHGRKRGAVCSSEVSGEANKQKKSNNVWMQCDKCRYTTRYNAFMVHHIRQHIKQRASCDKCGMQLTAHQAIHLCKDKALKTENVAMDGVEDDAKESFAVTSAANLNDEKEPQASIAVIQSDQQLENETKEDNVQLIRLASPDHLRLQNIIASGDETRTEQDVYVQVLQQVEDEEGNAHVAGQTNTGTTGMVVNVKEGTGKQMLTLAEDGSLEMVEVDCWDDVDPSHPDSDVPF